MIKVLIVDDDKLARKGLETLFPWEQCDMEVIGNVQNGSLALDLLEKETVDLLFVDIEMPVMNGIELMKICKIKYPLLQFVVLTFYEEFAYAKSAVKLGVLDYISKLELDPDEGFLVLQNIAQKYKERLKNSAYTISANSQPFYDSQWKILKENWSSLQWIYDKNLLTKWIEQTIAANPPLRDIELHLIKCLQRIDFESDRKESELPAFDSANDIFAWLISWLEEFYSYVVKRKDNSSMLYCIIRAIQYINDNIEQSLKSERIADIVGISRSYFSISFKKITGQTFHEYIKNTRINLGKKMLEETNKTITDIVYSIGYNDVNYFNRVFLEEVQCSPSEYRKLFQSKNKEML